MSILQQYTEKSIQQLIQHTISAANIPVALEQDQCGINMSYNFITNVVSFDADRLVEAAAEIYHIPFDLYVRTITLHELGHALDRPALQASLPRTLDFFDMYDRFSDSEIYSDRQLLALVIEEHEMNIAFEETAWDNAETLNRQLQLVDPHIFQHIRQHSLSSYLKNYEEDLLHAATLQQSSARLAQ